MQHDGNLVVLLEHRTAAVELRPGGDGDPPRRAGQQQHGDLHGLRHPCLVSTGRAVRVTPRPPSAPATRSEWASAWFRDRRPALHLDAVRRQLRRLPRFHSAVHRRGPSGRTIGWCCSPTATWSSTPATGRALWSSQRSAREVAVSRCRPTATWSSTEVRTPPPGHGAPADRAGPDRRRLSLPVGAGGPARPVGIPRAQRRELRGVASQHGEQGAVPLATGGRTWGAPNTWDDTASALGYLVIGPSARGLVAQTDQGPRGHVAWVADRHLSGTVTVRSSTRPAPAPTACDG